MSSPVLVISFTSPDQSSTPEVEVRVPLPEHADCDDMIETFRAEARKAAETAQATSPELADFAVDDLVVSWAGKDGVRMRYSVEGEYSSGVDDGGTWCDWVEAIDDEDAEFGMRFAMAVNEASDPRIGEIADFISTMEAMNRIAIAPEPVTKDEFRDGLKALVEALSGSGIRHPALAEAAGLLAKDGVSVPTSAGDALAEFFRGDTVGEFVSAHSVGEFPWEIALDAGGRIVVSDHDREIFYVVAADRAGYRAVRFDDVMEMIDPETEGTDLGSHEEPEAAFRAVLQDADLEIGAPAP